MLAPERITLYCKQKDEDGVYHAFPVDSANSNHDTAKSWATIQPRHWDREASKYVYGERTEPITFEYENQGFMNVKIESLTIRGEGGRAYQVILNVDDNKFRVDLREDTLMDVIKNTGIRAGGWLNGSFCFAKDGSQTKLIREGTELHKRAIAEREKREMFNTNLKRSDFKPGYKYSTIGGKSAIFLGFVYAYDINQDTGEISSPQKQMLFAKGNGPDTMDLLRTGKINYSEGTSRSYAKVSSYSFELMKSHTFKIENDLIIKEVNLPEFVAHIKEMAKLEYAKNMTTERYSRYFDSFRDPLKLATMAVEKKDAYIDPNSGKKILRKCEEYYRRW